MTGCVDSLPQFSSTVLTRIVEYKFFRNKRHYKLAVEFDSLPPSTNGDDVELIDFSDSAKQAFQNHEQAISYLFPLVTGCTSGIRLM